MQRKKKDSKFSHSSLLPQEEEKLNVINIDGINNDVRLNSNKTD